MFSVCYEGGFDGVTQLDLAQFIVYMIRIE